MLTLLRLESVYLRSILTIGIITIEEHFAVKGLDQVIHLIKTAGSYICKCPYCGVGKRFLDSTTGGSQRAATGDKIIHHYNLIIRRF